MWEPEIACIYQNRKWVSFLDQIINKCFFVLIENLHLNNHQNKVQINDLKILKPRYSNTQTVLSPQKYHYLYKIN